MRYGDGTTKGSRLADPRDPAVRLALKVPCPDCKAEPDQWCVGGRREEQHLRRRRRRLHFARCKFTPVEV